MLVRVSQRAAPGQNRARNVGRGKSRIYKGSTGRFLAARRRVLGGWTSGRTRWSSPRSSSSHCTVSPACTPMAAAKAQLNFQTHSRRALRCNILRIYLQEDYRGFASRLADSPLFQHFCGLAEIDKVVVPAKSTLQRYAHWIDQPTLDPLIHQALRQAHEHPESLQLAQPVDLEACFLDTTCLQANIHYPVDWVLLRDATRTLMKGVDLIRGQGLCHRMDDPARFLTRMNRLCIEMTHSPKKTDH